MLLRDSLPLDVPMADLIEAGQPGLEGERHVCVTDPKAIVRERVVDKIFTFTANSFFQNNNGILSSLVQSVRDILPAQSQDQYLVDAYCGSGLFAISLAERFKEVAGVEISGKAETAYCLVLHERY